MARATKAGSPEPTAFPLLRLLAVSAMALATANCAQNTQKLAAPAGSSYDAKYGVKASPRLYNEGDVIPKGGGRRFSGKPYVVAGRTYVPRDDAKGYVREGLASWYGSAFHGRMTANGEVFDRHSIAAAHPTLPLPSYARVTNLANGHSMIVRVNDRGPYHANRVMDVSEEVAGALEFRRSGTARVRVEYVGKASTAGSDDRKLMATLRTDGAPAAIGGRSPVMMADLGPEAAPAPERFARPEQPALAFKPEAGDETDGASAPAPRPTRPAPVLVAGGSSVAVPAALQPTAAPAHAFKPSLPSRTTPAVQMAFAAHRPPQASGPLSLAPPPLRLAGAGFAGGATKAAQAEPAMARHASVLSSGPAVGRARGAAGSPRVATAAMSAQAGLRPSLPAASGRAGLVRTGAPAGPATRVAMAAPTTRPVAVQFAPVLPAGSKLAIAKLPPAKLPTTNLSTAKLSTSKLATAPAGAAVGRAKLPVPAIAAAGTKAGTKRAQVAEVY